MEVLSLTVQESAATRMTPAKAAEMLSRACADFPDYRLIIELQGDGAIIRTEGMTVARWLRA